MPQEQANGRFGDLEIAVMVPCCNEEASIAGVCAGFKRSLPDATIYVYDNNSTDRTVELAKAAGAVVRREPVQGKGSVMRRMFADVEADVYILVDGDGTYDASSAPAMVQSLLDEHLDMVNGTRISTDAAAYRRGHRMGNAMLSGIVSQLFGDRLTDMLTGYRVFSRRFMKSFPATAVGFEIEPELTIHALELGIPLGEHETPYFERPKGGASKLRTYRDGWKVLLMIFDLLKRERPLLFFAVVGLVLLVAGLLTSIPVWLEYEHTGIVTKWPTALLCTALVGLSFLAVTCGLVMDSVAHGRKEAKRLAYLGLPRFRP